MSKFGNTAALSASLLLTQFALPKVAAAEPGAGRPDPVPAAQAGVQIKYDIPSRESLKDIPQSKLVHVPGQTVRWTLAKGAGAHKDEVVLDDIQNYAKGVELFLKQPGYKEFAKRYPELAIDNTLASPEIAKIISRGYATAGQLERIANAEAKLEAQMIDYLLVMKGYEPYFSGHADRMQNLRGTSAKRWNDGSLTQFTQSALAREIGVRDVRGNCSFGQLHQEIRAILPKAPPGEFVYTPPPRTPDQVTVNPGPRLGVPLVTFTQGENLVAYTPTPEYPRCLPCFDKITAVNSPNPLKFAIGGFGFAGGGGNILQRCIDICDGGGLQRVVR